MLAQTKKLGQVFQRSKLGKGFSSGWLCTSSVEEEEDEDPRIEVRMDYGMKPKRPLSTLLMTSHGRFNVELSTS